MSTRKMSCSYHSQTVNLIIVSSLLIILVNYVQSAPMTSKHNQQKSAKFDPNELTQRDDQQKHSTLTRENVR